eukprot:1573745-Rhodomonas_salina.4
MMLKEEHVQPLQDVERDRWQSGKRRTRGGGRKRGLDAGGAGAGGAGAGEGCTGGSRGGGKGERKQGCTAAQGHQAPYATSEEPVTRLQIT